MSGYRQLLRWAAIPVADRRWAAPLSAVALGFGLFAGVAIGPGAAGTLATGAQQIIEIPGFGLGADAGDDGPPSSSASGGAGSSGESSSPAPGLAPPSPAPFASSDSGFTEPAPSSSPASAPSPEEADYNIALADAVAVSHPDAPSESECADMSAILWQIYANELSALPFPSTESLQAWLCPDVPLVEYP